MKEKIKKKLIDAKTLAESTNLLKNAYLKKGNGQQYWYHRGRHMMLLTLIDELEDLLK